MTDHAPKGLAAAAAGQDAAALARPGLPYWLSRAWLRSQLARPPVRRTAAVFLAAYALFLIAQFPAGTAAGIAGIRGLSPEWSGTVWHGNAALRGGGDMGWTFAPLRSAARLGLAADLRITGPGTDLQAEIVRDSGQLYFTDVAGRVNWSLANAFGVRSDTVCDVSLSVDIANLALGAAPAANGSLGSAGGLCERGGGRTLTLPPLTGRVFTEGGAAVLTLSPAERTQQTLMSARLSGGGRLALELTAAGAALLPGARGRTTLETTL